VNAEHRALREAVAALLEKRSPESRVRALMATETGHDVATWRELADMGLLGLGIPEPHGGAAAGHVEMGIVMEEMGRTLLCAPFLSTAVLAPALLAAVGDGAEQEAMLPLIAAGEMVVTLAYAEGRSAVVGDRIATWAAHGAAGWSLTGTKAYVLDGLAADVFYVLADSDAGPSVFAVARNAPGLSPTALTTVDATRKLCSLQLRDAPARLVGAAGAGAAAFGAALERAAVALVAEQAGGAYHAMRMATEYATARFQFGRAIGSFQAIKHMCADMLCEAESAVSAARHVAAAYDAGAESRRADLALAQAFCSDAYVFVAATNIQVHGGIGFTWEHMLHRYYKRAQWNNDFEGTGRVHRAAIADLVLA
jgi:alkylation response protein AidB-like acyl-CoA dehydrogenase